MIIDFSVSISNNNQYNSYLIMESKIFFLNILNKNPK